MKLTFGLDAWLKLHSLMQHATTEIMGFGLARDPHRPLFIHDFILLPQIASTASAELNDEGIAAFTEQMQDAGYTNDQFYRVILHTHPGNSPSPSTQDEKMFDNYCELAPTQRQLGKFPWMCMFIIARESQEVYCRLRVRQDNGICIEREIPVFYSYSEATDPNLTALLKTWKEECDEKVKHKTYTTPTYPSHYNNSYHNQDWMYSPHYYKENEHTYVKGPGRMRCDGNAKVIPYHIYFDWCDHPLYRQYQKDGTAKGPFINFLVDRYPKSYIMLTDGRCIGKNRKPCPIPKAILDSESPSTITDDAAGTELAASTIGTLIPHTPTDERDPNDTDPLDPDTSEESFLALYEDELEEKEAELEQRSDELVGKELALIQKEKELQSRWDALSKHTTTETTP